MARGATGLGHSSNGGSHRFLPDFRPLLLADCDRVQRSPIRALFAPTHVDSSERYASRPGSCLWPDSVRIADIAVDRDGHRHLVRSGSRHLGLHEPAAWRCTAGDGILGRHCGHGIGNRVVDLHRRRTKGRRARAHGSVRLSGRARYRAGCQGDGHHHEHWRDCTFDRLHVDGRLEPAQRPDESDRQWIARGVWRRLSDRIRLCQRRMCELGVSGIRSMLRGDRCCICVVSQRSSDAGACASCAKSSRSSGWALRYCGQPSRSEARTMPHIASGKQSLPVSFVWWKAP